MRGLGAWILALLLVLGAATPALASQEGNHRSDGRQEGNHRSDGKVGVVLVSDKVPAVTAGDTVWIALTWRAEGVEARNFRVVAARARGVDVSYPANTGTYSSLMGDDTLSDGEMDFTSLRLSVPYDAPRRAEIELEVTYEVDGRTVRGVMVGKSRRPRDEVKLKIRVQRYSGADVAQVDLDPQAVVAGAGGWVDIAYTGYAPRVDDFRVVVTDAAGLALEYPQGSYTSLVHDAVLEDGETDVARVYVDTSGVAPGDYVLTVEATWSKAGSPGSLVGSVPVTVTTP